MAEKSTQISWQINGGWVQVTASSEPLKSLTTPKEKDIGGCKASVWEGDNRTVAIALPAANITNPFEFASATVNALGRGIDCNRRYALSYRLLTDLLKALKVKLT